MNPDFAQTDLAGRNYGLEVQREASMTLGHMVMPLFVVVVFAVVQGFRFGFRTSDYLFLMVGFSPDDTIGFLLCHGKRGSGQWLPRRTWMMFVVAGSSSLTYSSSIFSFIADYGDETFGNGRRARNLFEMTISNQANRIVGVADITVESLSTILEVDILGMADLQATMGNPSLEAESACSLFSIQPYAAL